MQLVHKCLKTISYNFDNKIDRYTSSNKTISQSNTIVDPENLQVETMKPFKT